MFTAFLVLVQLRLKLLVCDRSVSVNVITHTFVGLKCLTETKIQILCNRVSHTRLKSVQSALSDLKRPPERLQSQCNYQLFIT